jgi:hypothetical protein
VGQDKNIIEFAQKAMQHEKLETRIEELEERARQAKAGRR